MNRSCTLHFACRLQSSSPASFCIACGILTILSGQRWPLPQEGRNHRSLRSTSSPAEYLHTSGTQASHQTSNTLGYSSTGTLVIVGVAMCHLRTATRMHNTLIEQNLMVHEVHVHQLITYTETAVHKIIIILVNMANFVARNN